MGVGPFRIAAMCSIPRLPKFPSNDSSSLFLHAIFVEDQPDDLRALWIYCQATILYIIAQERPSKHYPLLHPPGLSPLHPGRRFSALLLGNRSHDGQPKLGVRLQSTDPVVHKQNTYPQCFQLSGVGDGVQYISRKTADLLGKDQVKFPQMGVGNHSFEGGSFLRRRSGDSFVGIDFIQLPVWLAVDVLLKISLLALK